MRTILFFAFIATYQRVVAAKGNESWLLLRLEALFCSIHLQYEGLIFLDSPVPLSRQVDSVEVKTLFYC